MVKGKEEESKHVLEGGTGRGRRRITSFLERAPSVGEGVGFGSKGARARKRREDEGRKRMMILF